MQKSTKYVFIGFIILVAIFLIFKFTNNASTSPGKYDDFAKCLTTNDVKFYGSKFCPHCANQKALFGNSFQYINYIECSLPDRSQNQYCNTMKIQAYPTWEFKDGKRVEGEQSIKELSDLTNCTINIK